MKAKGLKRLDIVTLFPEMVDRPLSESLIGKARERGLVDVRVHFLGLLRARGLAGADGPHGFIRDHGA